MSGSVSFALIKTKPGYRTWVITELLLEAIKNDMDTNLVLDSLSILFKSNSERLRPLLASKNLIVKHSLDIEMAKKYQKVLEEAGCITIIESELIFDDPELVQVSSFQNGLSPTDSGVTENPETKVIVSSVLTKTKMGTNMKTILIATGIAIIAIGLSAGVTMLSKEDKPDIISTHTESQKGKNISSLPVATFEANQSAPVALTILLSGYENTCPAKTPSGAKIALEATKIYDNDALDKEKICSITKSVGTDLYDEHMAMFIETVCNSVESTVSHFGNGDYQKAINGVKSMDQNTQTKVMLNVLEACKSNDSRRDFVLSMMNDLQYGIYSIGTFIVNGEQCIGYLRSIEKSESGKRGMSDNSYELYGAKDCPVKHVSLTNVFHPINNPSGVKSGTIIREQYYYTGDLPSNFRYKGIDYDFGGKAINNDSQKERNVATLPVATSGANPSTSVVQLPTSSNSQSTRTHVISDEKLGEIVSRENSNYLGDYYVVKLQPSGFSPINVDIKANTPEEALAKIVKKDDFLLVRRESNSEKIYVARHGKIIQLPRDFTVSESSPIGVSYQNGRLGPEEESVKFEGYSGLNGQTIVVAAKRFFALSDNSLNVDTDYIWNFASNREQYDKAIKTFNAAITELGSAKKEFNPDDALLWNRIMIPATQALMIAKMSGRDAEVNSIYTLLEEKFGNDPVDFLKGKLDLLINNSIKIDELSEAQHAQEQKILNEPKQRNTKHSIPNTRPPVPTINQQGDAVERYANSLASQLESSSHPACQAIASSIRSFGSSGSPDYVRQRQVDTIFDKAPGICF